MEIKVVDAGSGVRAQMSGEFVVNGIFQLHLPVRK